MKTIDETFIAAMREVVAERPNYVYPDSEHEDDDRWYVAVNDDYHFNDACVYSTPNGTPACLIGNAIAKIDLKKVPAYAENDAAGDVLPRVFPDLSEPVIGAAARAQWMQDRGSTWADALAAFEKCLLAEEVG